MQIISALVVIATFNAPLLCAVHRELLQGSRFSFTPTPGSRCSYHPRSRRWNGEPVRARLALDSDACSSRVQAPTPKPQAGRHPLLRLGPQLSLTHTQDAHSQRQWRTLEAVRHVGVAIVSSALTTVIATVPLFFCIIAPFAKFGKIVALNTGVSILYTLTVSTALLGIMAPGSFTRTRTSFLKALGAVLLAGALGLGACLLLLQSGYKIPLPDGTSL